MVRAEDLLETLRAIQSKRYKGVMSILIGTGSYLLQAVRYIPCQEIGEQYGIDNDRTVRRVFVHMKKTLTENRDLTSKMEKLQDIIKKSQEWT